MLGVFHSSFAAFMYILLLLLLLALSSLICLLRIQLCSVINRCSLFIHRILSAKCLVEFLGSHFRIIFRRSKKKTHIFIIKRCTGPMACSQHAIHLCIRYKAFGMKNESTANTHKHDIQKKILFWIWYCVYGAFAALGCISVLLYIYVRYIAAAIAAAIAATEHNV